MDAIRGASRSPGKSPNLKRRQRRPRRRSPPTPPDSNSSKRSESKKPESSSKKVERRKPPTYYLTTDKPWTFSSRVHDFRGFRGSYDLESRFNETIFRKNRFGFTHFYLILDPASGNSRVFQDRVCPVIRALPVTSRIGTLLNQIKEMARSTRCADMANKKLFGLRFIDDREEFPYLTIWYD
jgi:hypothetical protein